MFIGKDNGTVQDFVKYQKMIRAAQLQIQPFMKVVAIQSYNKRFVCSEQGGKKQLCANRNDIARDQKYDMIPIGINAYCFRSHANGKYLCAQDFGNKALIASRNQAKQWQTFYVTWREESTIHLKAKINNLYVSVEPDKNYRLIANKGQPQAWETFRLIYL